MCKHLDINKKLPWRTPPRVVCRRMADESETTIYNPNSQPATPVSQPCQAKKNSKAKKKVWTVEEELVVNCWVEKGCLFKTSSADYKRHDKKAAATEEMKRALHAQLGSVVTGKQTLLYYKNVLAISL